MANNARLGGRLRCSFIQWVGDESMVKVCKVGTLGCDATGTLRCGYLHLSQPVAVEQLWC